MNRTFTLLLIDEQVGAFGGFFLLVVVLVVERGRGEISPKAFGLNVGWIEGRHLAVIELDPLVVAGLDVADVVPRVSSAAVADDADQVVVVLLVELLHPVGNGLACLALFVVLQG